MKEITLISALIGGMLSFLSPCVLPLIPAYISLITGYAIEELTEKKKTFNVILSSIYFILGFTISFISLQVIFKGLFLIINKKILNIILGSIVIIFGINFLGILKLKFLYYQKGLNISIKKASLLGAFIMGIGFGFAWTPCIGPILASILILAGKEETIFRGIILLLVYSIGFGLPFILSAIFLNKFIYLISKYKRVLRISEFAAGVLLIIIGILIITDNFNYLYL